jgi:hypothetical protein
MSKNNQSMGNFGTVECAWNAGIVHAHVRDPYLAMLPKEALEALARSYDEVLAQYALQDGPVNQAGIKPAIEAELVTNDVL